MKKGGEKNAENQTYPQDHSAEKENEHADEDQEVSLRNTFRWCPGLIPIRDTA
jgi:hypothetical protein